MANKKTILITLSVFIFVGLLAAAWFFSNKKTSNPSEQKEDSSSALIYNLEQEEFEATKNLIAIDGKITSINADSLVVSSEEGEITLVLSEATKVNKGVIYEDSSINELSLGDDISIVYNKKTSVVQSIWYE